MCRRACPLRGHARPPSEIGLTRPWAGVGVYTTQILRAMAVERPDCRFTIYVPPGVPTEGSRSTSLRDRPHEAMGRGRRLHDPDPEGDGGGAPRLPLHHLCAAGRAH